MMRLYMMCFLISQGLLACGQEDTARHKWGDWNQWGDLNNGHYNNPVLPADYSDVDCIRVGEVYFAVSSTFQYSPGIVILKSRDLVNWKIAGHVVKSLTQISPEMNWNKMNRYGRGIWAGAIRYYNKKYYVYFGTPDEGFFMSYAKDVQGLWSPLYHVLNGVGWDDCCPFWDDDGKAYLIGTNFKDNYKIHLFRMTADGTRLIKGYDWVIHQSKGSEANKIYKIKGTYYHLFSDVKSDGRAIMMERSKDIRGPYLEMKELSYAQVESNEPNQGGLIEAQTGKWYFLTHHGTGDWSGRVLSLLPVTWFDGWPIIGKPDPSKIGRMVWSDAIPLLGSKGTTIQTSDEFNTSRLEPQWEWNYQPRDSKWSLAERKGWLRLKAFRPLDDQSLLRAGNTLTQRTLRTKFNEVTTKLDLAGLKDGEHAGLAHFGSPDYSAIGVFCQGKTYRIEYNYKGVFKYRTVILESGLWLRSIWGLDGKSHYYYSINGKKFKPFGVMYQMAWGSYRGDRIAIYNYNTVADKGYIDIDYLHYTYRK